MPYVKLIMISTLFANFSFAQSAYSEFQNEEPIISSDIIIPEYYKTKSPKVDVVEEYSPKVEAYSGNRDKNLFNELNIHQEGFPQTEVTIEEKVEESYPSTNTQEVRSSNEIDYTSNTNHPPVAQPEIEAQVEYLTPITPYASTSLAQPQEEYLPSYSSSSNSLQNKQQDIKGHFRFIEGVKSYGESINKKIVSGYMVIEKLDENNYGFYYTFKVETHSPDNYFGIFRYKNGKFYQRVIQKEGSLITEDLENIKIVTGDNKLELRVNTQNGGRILIWELDNYGKSPDSKELKLSLDDAKRSYIQVYKQKFSQLN